MSAPNDPQLIARAVALIERGRSLRAVARKLDIAQSTLSTWFQRGKGGSPLYAPLAAARAAFLERERQARVEAEERARAERAQKTSKTTPALHVVEAPRDTRPPVKPEAIARAIVAGAEAIAPLLRGADGRPPRFVAGDAWKRLRPMFHTSGDAERREAIVRLLLEELERIQHDDAVTLKPFGIHAPRRAGEDR